MHQNRHPLIRHVHKRRVSTGQMNNQCPHSLRLVSHEPAKCRECVCVRIKRPPVHLLVIFRTEPAERACVFGGVACDEEGLVFVEGKADVRSGATSSSFDVGAGAGEVKIPGGEVGISGPEGLRCCGGCRCVHVCGWM
jgi:hypothetical protein